ncbi:MULTISPECIES: asparagine synthetase B family protein [unclassified Paenibacillus]|uniref:asparagine synthase-related protein n=1 Tax=unclassified Paenibacillus TaxID=185978 RepID=UPI000CFB8CAB|nr:MULTISPECIES: asparagine synthetase B family protein [unclassified Paenibacillus]PRA03514.1 asparagine synthase [Paenibacillus sp. MYb63]PRA46932.1 asparagine synthase [Paenibacillus sp. MYb67]
MKIWIAMQGQNQSIWLDWMDSIKRWARVTGVNGYTEDTFHLATLSYGYGAQASSTSADIRLDFPIILDGWASGELQAHADDFPSLSSDQQEQAYRLLQEKPEYQLCKSQGEFTLVYWDQKRSSLIVATDSYATRPVYYWISPRNEWFVANDLRVLLLLQDIPFEVDEDVCRMYPTSGFAVGENGLEERTFFKGIRKLPTASIAWWNNHQVKVQSYWGMRELTSKPQLTEDAVPQFRQLLEQVTQERFNGNKRMVELSGGLDSAAVVAAAIASGNQEQILAVNISFAEPDMMPSHDKDLVKKMMRDLRIPGLIIHADETARIPNAEIGRDPLWFVDGPDPRANSLVNETFTVLARQFRTAAVLTGEGGDFVYSGEVAVIDSYFRQKRYREGIRELREWAGNRVGPMLKKGFQYGLAPFLPYFGEKWYYKLLWSDTEYDLPEFFTNEHLQRERQMNAEEVHRYRKSRPLNYWGKRYHYDFLWPRARYMDAVGVTLPAYHPFLDRRIIEFSFSVPPEQHFDLLKGEQESYAGSKLLLRKAFTDILPSYVYNRSSKTTYAHMARKSFLNDRQHILQLFASGKRVYVTELGIIDQRSWWKHLVAMAIRSEDPNNDLGMGYQYMRSVIDLEIWLQEMSRGKEHVLNRSRPSPARMLGDIEEVNMNEKKRLYFHA